MALSREQFQALRDKGLSTDQIIRFEGGQKPAPKAPSLMEKLGGRYKQGVVGGATALATPGITSLPRAALRGAGAVAGGVNDVIGAAIAPVLGKALQSPTAQNIGANPIVSGAIKGASAIADKSSQVFKQAEQRFPTFTQDVKDAANIATLVPLGRGASAARKALPELPKPTPSANTDPSRIVGTIVQGTKKDIPKATAALKGLNVKDVKTYGDLSSALDRNIKQASLRQDEILDLDKTPRPLASLTASQKVGEQTVTHNYVEDALNHLSELYGKTNDPVGAEQIRQLAVKANGEGLTVKEINNLARLHGSEFSTKAFSKIGEPLTSVNAQAFENTRSGLKTTARDLFDNPEYKQLDDQLSSNIQTQKLVKKVDEQVNKLKQRVTDRGLGEKVGRAVFQAIDIVSGGAVRGFMQSFIPRSAGLKIMNALDLEQNLQKNLQQLQRILDTVPENQIENQIKGLIQSSNSSRISTLSASSLSAQKTNMPKSTPNTNNINTKLPPRGNSSNAFGAAVGFTPDEEGNLSFDPINAALGIAGLGISKKASQALKTVTPSEINGLNELRGAMASKLTNAAAALDKHANLIEKYGLTRYQFDPAQLREHIEAIAKRIGKERWLAATQSEIAANPTRKLSVSSLNSPQPALPKAPSSQYHQDTTTGRMQGKWTGTKSSKPSTVGNMLTGSAPLGKGGGSAPKTDISDPFDGAASTPAKTYYHGSPNKIEGAPRPSKTGIMGEGFYLAPTKDIADYFGKQVTNDIGRQTIKGATANIAEFDVSKLKLYELDDKSALMDFVQKHGGTVDNAGLEKARQYLIKQGYDGIDLTRRGETVVFPSSIAKLQNTSPSIPKGLEGMAADIKAGKYKNAEEFENSLPVGGKEGREIGRGLGYYAPRSEPLGKTDKLVTVYRGIPKNQITKIVDGDYVSLSDSAAASYGQKLDTFKIPENQLFKAVGKSDYIFFKGDTRKSLTDFFNKVKGGK